VGEATNPPCLWHGIGASTAQDWAVLQRSDFGARHCEAARIEAGAGPYIQDIHAGERYVFG
jgi:hypothetical protein